jgi:hypothetical protein
LLDDLNPAELLHAVFSLTPDDQRALLSILSPEKAASLIQDLPDAHVADLIEEMPATSTAPIVGRLQSNSLLSPCRACLAHCSQCPGRCTSTTSIVLGVLPLVLASGTGAALRVSLGAAVSFGIPVSFHNSTPAYSGLEI